MSQPAAERGAAADKREVGVSSPDRNSTGVLNMTESRAAELPKRFAEMVVLPALVALVVYYVTEPYVHGKLAGATGVIVAEVAAHWTVVGSTSLLYFVANYLSRRTGIAFLVLALASWWGVKTVLVHLGCAPPYVAVGSLGLAPAIGFFLALVLGSMRRLRSSGADDSDAIEPDYRHYGVGKALEGIGRLYSLIIAIAIWLATSAYSALVIYSVLHRGLSLSTGLSIMMSLCPLFLFAVYPIVVILALVRSGKTQE
jgi:hypothetical protein